MSAILLAHEPDSTPATPVAHFFQARLAFRGIEDWLVGDEAGGLAEAEVEERLEQRGRELLRLMLQAHLRQRGTGDVGPALRVFAPAVAAADPPAPTEGVRHGQKRLHGCGLHSLFGEVGIERTAYAAAGCASVHPLDEQLALPQRCFSHPLQERLVLHAVQGPFDEAVDHVRRSTGIRMSKRSAEQVVAEAAVDFQGFYERPRADGAVQARQTGSIVVTGIDCKGVPMIKPEETLRKARRGKGDKKHKKRMATVATVRTQQPRVRTPADVVESLFRDAPKPKRARGGKKPAAPAEHKRVWADLLASKDEVVAEAAAEAKRADPEGDKTHVALCDGERALQQRIVPALVGAVGAVILVLDLMHVVEKLWQVAHCFHAEGSAEASSWVRKQLLRVLQGDSSQVVKGMRQSATKRGLKGTRRETVDRVAGYMRRNRENMRYDEYLRQGLPIASGCVEGACKNLVKDRMERSGMRWSLGGAQAMIRLRALHLSGDLDEYWDYHLQQEHRRNYPPGRWEVVEK